MQARQLPLSKRIEPDSIVVDQFMGLLDLRRGHLLDHFLLADRGVRIAANRAQHVPEIGSDKVRSRHAAPDLVVPADTRLRTGMALHGCPQIPFESPDIIPLDAESEGIHHTDQFLGVGVPRTRSRPKLLARILERSGLHQLPGMLDIRKNGPSKEDEREANERPQQDRRSTALGVRVGLGFAAMASCAAAGTPILDDRHFHPVNPKAVEAGRLLFFDPVLSGNKNIACATCHHPDHGTSDNLSLGLGEGGFGLGPERSAGAEDSQILKRIPRNAPGLWNLGAQEIRVLLHDGRVSISDLHGNGFDTPAAEDLPVGLRSILAAQALFPVTSEFEMVGQREENEVAKASRRRLREGWRRIAERIRSIPEYDRLLREAYPDLAAGEEVEIRHVANALSDFVNAEFRSFDSAYDRFLAGETNALDPQEARGMQLFFGKAGCSNCHNGRLLSDQEFHALALPHIGPGRTRPFDPYARDVGRMGESDRNEDAYRFRTPMLRNVALTAPYGHNGAYRELRDIVLHHLDPIGALSAWTPRNTILPAADWLAVTDFLALDDRWEMERLRARVDILPVLLEEAEIDDLVAFLHALTGTASIRGRLGIPDRVPSGLAIDR